MDDSFVMFTEQWPAIALLSEVQRGALLQAVFAHHGACSMPQLDTTTQAIFLMMRPRFDSNKAKYEQKCESNRVNGQKGGRPRKDSVQTVTEEKPKNPTVFDENPKTLLDTDPDTDPDTDLNLLNTPPNPPQGGGGGFCAAHADNPTPNGDSADSMGSPQGAAPALAESWPDIVFCQLLDAYPEHKRDPGIAWRAWLALSRAGKTPNFSKLLESLTLWLESEQWNKDPTGQFVPLLSNWIAGSKWEIRPAPRASPHEKPISEYEKKRQRENQNAIDVMLSRERLKHDKQAAYGDRVGSTLRSIQPGSSG